MDAEHPDASALDCGTIIGRDAVLVSAPWREPSDPPNGPDDHIDNVFNGRLVLLFPIGASTEPAGGIGPPPQSA
jgi:hypothetical protein